MKTLKIPTPITLVNVVTDEPFTKSDTDLSPDDPWTIFRWAAMFIVQDPNFGKEKDKTRNAKTAAATARILRVLKRAVDSNDTEVPMDDMDIDFMKRVCDDPGKDWPPLIHAQFMPFIDAVMNAK